jgi:acyl carrier protein
MSWWKGAAITYKKHHTFPSNRISCYVNKTYLIWQKGEFDMTLKEKLNLLEELLLVEKDTLDEATELSNIAEWDSMAVISTIAMFDSVYSKDIKSEEIKNFRTVKDIIDKME